MQVINQMINQIVQESKIKKIIFSSNSKIEIHRVFKVTDGATLVLYENGLVDSSIHSIKDSKQTSPPITRVLNSVSLEDSHLLGDVTVTLSDGKLFKGELLNPGKISHFYQNQFESFHSTLVAVNDTEIRKLVDLKSHNPIDSKIPFKTTHIENIESNTLTKSVLQGTIFIDVFGEGEREIEVVYSYFEPHLNFQAIKKIDSEDSGSNNNSTQIKDNPILRITQMVSFNPRMDIDGVNVEFEIEKDRYEVKNLSCSKLTTSVVQLNSFVIQAREGYFSVYTSGSNPTLAPCILFDNTSPYSIFSGSFNKFGVQNLDVVKPGHIGVLTYLNAQYTPQINYSQQERFSKTAIFSSSKISNSTNNSQQQLVKKRKKSFFSKLLSKRPHSPPQPFEHLNTTSIEHLDSIKCSTSFTIVYVNDTEVNSYRYTNLQNQDMEIIFSLKSNERQTVVPSEHLKKLETEQSSSEDDEEEEESPNTTRYRAIIQGNSMFDFSIHVTSQNMQKYSYGPSEYVSQLIKPSKPTSSHQFETVDLSKKNINPKEAIDSMVNYNKKSYTSVNTTPITSSVTSSSSSGSSGNSSWFSKRSNN